MNPIFGWLTARARARAKLRMLTRHCPQCRRRQVVEEQKMREEAPCKYCGAPMPPPAFNKTRVLS